jgi:hypothetical protein
MLKPKSDAPETNITPIPLFENYGGCDVEGKDLANAQAFRETFEDYILPRLRDMGLCDEE